MLENLHQTTATLRNSAIRILVFATIMACISPDNAWGRTISGTVYAESDSTAVARALCEVKIGGEAGGAGHHGPGRPVCFGPCIGKRQHLKKLDTCVFNEPYVKEMLLNFCRAIDKHSI